MIAWSLLAACGGGSDAPGQTEAPAVSPVGSYDDPNDVRSFGSELKTALEKRDLEFFLTNVQLHEVSCAEDSPPPPPSCGGREAGATVPAILVGVWEGEDFYLDAAGYEDFMLTFLTETGVGDGDAYGSPEPALYAYAILKPEFRVAPPAQDSIEAILTRIPAAGEREALLVSLGFDGESWAVTQLVDGPATFLDPAGPRPPSDSGLDSIFEFWALWEN